MAAPEPFLTDEQRQLLKSMSFGGTAGADGALSRTLSAAETPQSKPSKHAFVKGASAGSNPKQDRRSHTGKPSRPKKGGAGGRGTWGKWLETGGEACIDRNDPNYDSDEEPYKLVTAPATQSIQVYKDKVKEIIEEYFTTDNVAEAAEEIREVGCSMYHHYFVKKLISMSLDRHDREKEMAAVLLSALYADLIQPDQVMKGFAKLIESADDLAIDIPDAVDILALFVARAVVDDILPPVFLKNMALAVPQGSKGWDVIEKADKSYLSACLRAEIVERRWGGSTHTTVETVKTKISALLSEYIESGDGAEARRCIRELNVPFFHHEVVKKALTLAMENRSSEARILSLLKVSAEEGLITSSQFLKGFTRVADAIDDVSLDIPDAKSTFQHLVSKAAEGGFLSAASVKTLTSMQTHANSEADQLALLKQKVTGIIQEYFASDDVTEVIRSLKDLAVPHLNHVFVKRLIILAMERKNHEREMASVLLSSLYAEALTTEDCVTAFVSLLESAEDTTLDIPDAGNLLALFLARAVVDNVFSPLDFEEIKKQLLPDSLGSKIVHAARSVLAAPHANERILRCWGGGSGWAVDDAKDKIIRLLEEYEAGGDVLEACHCIRDLDMPFFHHEVVKKTLVMAMEKQNDALLNLLEECSNEGLITVSQMSKGFTRVADSLDDLALDIPNAKAKFACYLEKAKTEGWLIGNFTADEHPMSIDANGYANGEPNAEKALHKLSGTTTPDMNVIIL